ncbi:MAG TPA: transporter [Flavobacteriales bacterium]|nr:transporter [Flavobacteriales bacterium]
MIFRKTSLLILLVSAVVSGSEVYGQMTLEQCHEKARNNYPLIRQFDLIEQSKDFTVSNANKNYLPQLSVTAIGGIVDGFPSIGPSTPTSSTSSSSSTDVKLISIVQLNQVIWDGGITKSVKEISEINAKVERADVEVSLYTLKSRVNNLFFGILLIDEQKAQLEFVKGTLRQNLNIATAAYQNGVAYQSDLDEINVELLNLEQQLTELEYNRSAFVGMLSLLTGEEITEDQEFTPPVLTEELSSLEIKRPELDLFSSQEELIESQTKMKRSGIYPKLGLMGLGTFIQPGISFGQEEMNQLLVAGLSLSWELGSIYRRSNDKKLGEVNLNKIDNRRETFLFSTRLELTRVEQDIEKYKALMERDEQLIKLKTSIKNSYQSQYDNGVARLSDLLIRINDENMARQSFIVHEIQYLMAVYEYKTTSGN